MNKQIPVVAALCGLICGAANAQSSIPNGNFEKWTSDTYEYPANYPYNSNEEGVWRKIPFNLTKITDAYHGTYAVQLTTNNLDADTSVGYFINADADGSNWHGGFAYSQTPTGIRGYYKCNIMPGDSALIVASFSKAGNNIGMYFFKIGGVQANYTMFNFTLNPPLPVAPDSVMFGATSSDFLDNVVLVGSTLILDSVSFTGVASQPALMNGSFESWQSQTIDSPDDWYSERGEGVNQTTDVAAGNYAIELTTTPGDYGYGPRAVAGRISTGYYDNSCGCMMGGYPFSNQVDTLVFSYKYVPSGNDSANVSLNFKKNGASINWAGIYLPASASYQVVEIPFDAGQVPDTVVAQFESSLWYDSLLSYVGSSLKIDEIYFKSQPLNTSVPDVSMDDRISAFPNPFSTQTTILANRSLRDATLAIYNAFGQQVKEITAITTLAGQTIILYRDNLPGGLYFLRLTEDNKAVVTGKLLITN